MKLKMPYGISGFNIGKDISQNKNIFSKIRNGSK